MNESGTIKATMSELAEKKVPRPWLSWLVGFLLLICAGVAAWMALEPAHAQRLVAVEVADLSSLSQGKLGEQIRIPIRVTNRSDKPIRLVGNNAC